MATEGYHILPRSIRSHVAMLGTPAMAIQLRSTKPSMNQELHAPESAPATAVRLTEEPTRLAKALSGLQSFGDIVETGEGLRG